MIRLAGVSRSFNGTSAVSNVSFVLEKGSRLVLIGPSGSGKTTLLRLVAGLELPDAGEVYLDGSLASRPGWGLPPGDLAPLLRWASRRR